MATATVAATAPLSNGFLLRRGPNEGAKSARSLQRTKNQRQSASSRRFGAAVITAKFDLKPPPYPLNALEPHMSANTLSFHWGKHHRAYVDNLNKQIVGTELEAKSLEDIVIQTYNDGDLLPPFNNAAQIWNHDFFWESMKPGGGGKPSGELLKLIERDFGSFEKLCEELRAAAATQFGSGWAWLAFNPRPSDGKELLVVKSPNAVNPLVLGYIPLLTIDVWEVREL
ncbi:hypothetical protein EUGRSUZ_K00110 [Eucalyptus grandis]|uniref:Uncharacterized protein n=2 Tax=Eucalyptus grandis TaxID=71139 RepID=A0ACC3IP69_EUCGR|nr:hypothetical protein EUGRSUZ_K00110 [Eucalyptus grandis]